MLRQLAASAFLIRWTTSAGVLGLLLTRLTGTVGARMPEAQKITVADTEEDDVAYDKKRFYEEAKKCLDDKTIVNYFGRGLVQPAEVLKELHARNVFDEALGTDAYSAYSKARRDLRDSRRGWRNLVTNRAINPRTVLVAAILMFILVVLFQNSSSNTNSSLVFGAAVSGCGAGLLLISALRKRSGRLAKTLIGVLLLAGSVSCVVAPHVFTIQHPLNPVILSASGAVGILAGLLLGSGKTLAQCVEIYKVFREEFTREKRTELLKTSLDSWLKASVEKIVMPQLVLIINTLLGDIREDLLVEQDSEGLRRLQDPRFMVSTGSEAIVSTVLSQMDGGSIALAGPRGAGKTTLLKKFTDPQAEAREPEQPTIRVYVQAPAEYAPRDFIAEVFQHLCEAYLKYSKDSVPDVIGAKPTFSRVRRTARKGLGLCWLAFRALAAIAVVAWLVWPYARAHYPHYRESLVHVWDHDRHRIAEYTERIWDKYRLVIQAALVLTAIIVFPSRKRWRRWRRAKPPEKTPSLADRAREYLSRLQVDKTITAGTSLSSPSMHGFGVGLQKGSSVRYVPWTLPELVRYVKLFMADIASEFESSSQAVLIGIDEIDRIGSLEHAERFISEVKAIFGTVNCFFLVAVAEDVGSVFAQRATAGRSILENAFDDVVAVEPLSLDETRLFLQRRVPGFTDSFVYLVHALSGGLPRELIRISRRLVDVNLDLQRANNIDPDNYRYPRLSELSLILVTEGLSEAVRASRNQLSLLTLSPDWTDCFNVLRTSSANLLHESPVTRAHVGQVIAELSTMSPPPDKRRSNHHAAAALADEKQGRQIIEDLAAFAYFGSTVIDAFADTTFNLASVKERAEPGQAGSYEQLALARAELSVSTASSLAMLKQFRATLTDQPVASTAERSSAGADSRTLAST